MDFLIFISIPLVACLLLIGITSYFGIHVIKREILFIDIALAQIAALGATVAHVMEATEGHGHDEHTFGGYMLSLLFCTLAAGLFTMLKNKNIKIPLEGFIGIAYAVATTGAVIILDKSAGSDVHVHDMLVGSVLWVSWHQVVRLAVVVAVVAGFHALYRKKFTTLTDHYDHCSHKLKYPKFWDFLFYFTFGLVIVEAVDIAGILTVFAFLIIPSSITALFQGSWARRIIMALWIGGVSVILGLSFSWQLDVPASPVIIVFLSLALGVAGIVKGLQNRKVRKQAAGA